MTNAKLEVGQVLKNEHNNGGLEMVLEIGPDEKGLFWSGRTVTLRALDDNQAPWGRKTGDEYQVRMACW